MKTSAKNLFTHLSKIPFFNNLNKKLILNNDISNDEYTYLLQIAIIFYDEYLKSGEIDYLNYSYYLILKYYLTTNDNQPLLNMTLNTGIYPITEVFLRDSFQIDNILFYETLSQYNNGKFYEMLKQHECINNLIHSNSRVRAYIAPTSYGKSEFIKKDISIQLKKYNKVAIIVPKKVLIWETYQNVKNICRELQIPVLLHDTEYENQERFVGIFTQERALRLLSSGEVVFDSLYIDEAHNLFIDDNYRSVFLARLIRLCENRNGNCKVTYLSPLISDADNIKIKKAKNDTVDVQRIDFNIKLPDVSFFDSYSGCIEKYNVFSNTFVSTNKTMSSWYEYILSNSREKNLVYFYSPKDIVGFTMQFCELLPDILCDEVDGIAQTVSRYIDRDYLMVTALKKGVVFLHSKIPDFIKEYLIHCFKTIPELKYIVSNSAIFEGVNLPLDSLFIMNVRALTEKTLINLCGRINRLNNIFGNQVHLDKLIYPVHFLKTPFSKKQNVKSKIVLLRNDDKDNVENPLLEKTKMDDKKEKIVELENIIMSEKEADYIKKTLVANGINSLFNEFDLVYSIIKTRVLKYKGIELNIQTLQDILNLLYSIFIDGIDNKYFKDLSLRRLLHQETKNFYNAYVSKGLYYENIRNKIHFFKHIFESDIKLGKVSYVGKSFGEVGFSGDGDAPLCVEMWNKSDKQIVDYAVARSEEEDDFVDYTLGKLIKALLDLELITKDNYNLFLYNTTDQETIKLMSMGLTTQVISYFRELNLLGELISSLRAGGKIGERLKEAINSADDLTKFEIYKAL